MTSLYHDIIFGPVHSRQLGLVGRQSAAHRIETLFVRLHLLRMRRGQSQHPGRRRFNPREVRLQLGAVLRRGGRRNPAGGAFAGSGELPPSTRFPKRSSTTRSPARRTVPLGTGFGTEATPQNPPRRRAPRIAARRQQHPETRLGVRRRVRRMNNPAGDYSVARTIELMKRFEGHDPPNDVSWARSKANRSATPPNGRSRHGCGSWRDPPVRSNGLLARPRHPVPDAAQNSPRGLQRIAARVESAQHPCP